MAKQNVLLNAFNRGIISKLALARTDLKRTALSAEIQHNYMPRVLGSMMLRPGWVKVAETKNDNTAIGIPFIFSKEDTAIVEVSDSIIRVLVDETVISRPSVSSAITNGTFATDLTGWTSGDETGATSQWISGGGSGLMSLTGTGFNRAIRTQQVSVTGGDIGTEHALNIHISNLVGRLAGGGNVTLRVGSTSGDDDYITETSLAPGYHSLALTPTGNFFIHLSNSKAYATYVNSIVIASSGNMEITAPWGEDELPFIRWAQSGDVLFESCEDIQQYRIERRATRSWSAVLYQSEDGPFRVGNTGPISISASVRNGDTTLTASAELFRPEHVGTIFKIESAGQAVSGTLAGAAQFTDSIKVTGVGSTQRTFSIAISGTWSGTISLQRSTDDSSWSDVSGWSWTANVSVDFPDSLDNQIIYYRLGFKTANYTSGSAVCTLTYATGSNTGVVRITYYTNATSVTGAVVRSLGNTDATTSWAEGQWSDYRGWPSANSFYEGRLWWAGKDKIVGSVSDEFDSFDDSVEGDSGPLNRSIGEGPVDRINWLLPLLRLMVGCELAERSARSSSLDEPLTPTNFNLKAPSTRGSSPVPPGKIDSAGVFVRKNRLFELAYNETYSVNSDYGGNDLTMLCPEVGGTGFTRIAVQRYPDTRIHCIREDGQVAVMVFDRAEDVKCWITVDTDGDVEDVFVLPGDEEDKVYYIVKRTIGGNTKRFLERWALESECTYGTTIYDGDSTLTISDLEYADGTVVTLRDSSGTKIGNNLTVDDGSITLASGVTYATITPSLYKLADSHVIYSGVATTTATAAHLAGEEVVIWGDGIDLGTFTLNGSGQVTIPSVETYCVGLYYRARYKSSKLAYAAEGGTALTQKKRVNYLGVIASSMHASGLMYGPDFDSLDDLPEVEKGVTVDGDYIWPDYDETAFEFSGDYDTDSRICLQSEAPKPCTLQAMVVGMQTNEK